MAPNSLSQVFVLATLVLPTTWAFVVPGFAPATTTYKGANWNPNPTAAPAIQQLELFKRQNSFSVGADGFNTTIVPDFVCGYIGGVWSFGATCSASSSCFYDQNSQIVGCCTTKGVCTSGIYTSCYDGYGVKGADSPFVYTCAGTSRCYVNTYIGTSRSTYRQYGCGNLNESTTIWQTFSDMPSTVVLPIHYSSFDYNGAEAVGQSSSSSSSSSPTSSPTEAAHHSNHAGAIAGGVVGGLAGLALIFGLLFFALRRYRKSKTPVYQPETTYAATNEAEKHPPSPYNNAHNSYPASQGQTTLVSPPHSPQPQSDMGHPGYLGVVGAYSDSPHSDHIGTYHGPHGSDVGSDYNPAVGPYRAYSPSNEGQGYGHLGPQPHPVQEIEGTAMEAPRYEMEHTNDVPARKPVGSPRAESKDPSPMP